MRAKVAASVAAYAAAHPDSEETRKKKGAAKKGVPNTPEANRKIGEAERGRPRPDMVTGGKNAHNRFTGPWTDEMRAAKSAATKGKVPPGYKRFWENASQEEKDRAIQLAVFNASMHPNKAELLLQEILEEILPGCYEYTGDGSVIIGGKNPDFISGNNLIELFGDYWHRGEDPSKRIAGFRKYGFRTLVIWEKELIDPELPQRISDFHTRAYTSNITE